MERRCRLCMKRGGELENIIDYDTDNGTTLIQQISLFFAIEITLTDHLPKDVCRACIKFVQLINSRRNVFLENQDKLKDELYSALKKNCAQKTIRHQEPTAYKLSDLKIPPSLKNEDIFPTVEIINLEESDVVKEYRKVSEFTYKKVYRGVVRPADNYPQQSSVKRKATENSVLQSQQQPATVAPVKNYNLRPSRQPELVICDENVKMEPEDAEIKEEPPVIPLSHWMNYEAGDGQEEMPIAIGMQNCRDETEDMFQADVAEKVFLCSQCGEVFGDFDSLSLHSKTHSIKVEAVSDF